MNSKKKVGLFFSSLVAVGIITVVLCDNVNNNRFKNVYGEGSTYTLSVDYRLGTLTASSSTGYTSSTYGPAITSLGNSIGFSFVNGMKSSTSSTPDQIIGQLKASSGLFYNTTAITGIKSITANYVSTSNMTLYLGTSSNPTQNTTTITNGVAINLDNSYSYFAIKSGSNYVNLTSLAITYTCDGTATPGESSSSSSEETPTSNQYTLVSSSSDLTVDSSYLMVAANSGNYYAAGALTSTYLTSVSVTAPVSNTITIASQAVVPFVLGGSTGSYTLTSVSGQLYSSAAKNVNYSSNGTGTWSITVSSGVSTITSTTTSCGSITYNVSSPRFTTYTSGQTAIALYKRAGSQSGGSSSSEETVTLSSIAITTSPTKTSYISGEALSLTGMVVTAYYSDTTSAVISSANYTTNPASGTTLSTVGTTSVVVSYTLNGTTKTTTFDVTVSSAPTVSVTGVTLNNSTLSLNVGGTSTLVATVAPTDATNKSVNWSTTSQSIATVSSSGLVTAIAAGTATITVTTVDQSKSASCTVTVSAATSPSGSYRIQFDTTGTSDSSTEYTTSTLLSSGITSGSTYVSSISATSKAYRGNGGLKLGSSSAAGSFTIALSNSGKVSVRKIVLSAKKYSTDTTSMSINSLTAQTISSSTFTELEYTTSGTISTISLSGTGKRCYISYIDVYYGEQTAVNMTAVTLNNTTLSLSTGGVSNLVASFSPTNVYPTPSVVWSTENSSVATVVGGTVTGVAVGTTNIIATATQGSIVLAASCSVTVSVATNYTTKTMAYDYQDYMDNNYYSGMNSMPSVGNVNLLVIPVQLYGYSTNATAATKERIRQAYFGTEAETGWQSVASFYHTESKGKLTITGVVSDWYSAPSSTYGTSITEDNTTALVTLATKWYKTTYNSTCKEFDSDGDGCIDGVILIYNAPNNYNSNDNLWAYTYWTTASASTSSPTANTYFWASYDFMNESSNCSVDAHTYIHELGHVMGLEDYYNYDSTSTYGAAGAFSMQDYNVGEHDPYSRVALGWIDPIVATGNATIAIAPGDAIILSATDLSTSSPFDEYLILDVYSPTGLNYFDSTYKYGGSSSMYPQGPNVVGIRTWHVDARLMKNYSGSTPTLATTIVSGSKYVHAMNNSTNSTYGSLYASYRSYKLLHLLQAGGTNTYQSSGQFSASDVWTAGKSFSMSSYASFFVNSGKLNSNTTLPYSFSVTSISGTNVTISITKS